jgi:hypothetical protein
MKLEIKALEAHISQKNAKLSEKDSPVRFYEEKSREAHPRAMQNAMDVMTTVEAMEVMS